MLQVVQQVPRVKMVPGPSFERAAVRQVQAAVVRQTPSPSVGQADERVAQLCNQE